MPTRWVPAEQAPGTGGAFNLAARGSAMRFEGDRALVTGSTGGIGEAIARRLADEGAAVGLHTYSRVEQAHALADELDGTHAVLEADLMRERAPSA